jgi:hypothetical protein
MPFANGLLDTYSVRILKIKMAEIFKMATKESVFLYFGNLNGAVVNVAECYPTGAGFDSRVVLGFFPHAKEVEDIGPFKRNLLALFKSFTKPNRI